MNVMGKHTSKLVRIDVVMNVMSKHTSKLVRIQGSTLTVARLPRASEMRLRASENGSQLARSGFITTSILTNFVYPSTALVLINTLELEQGKLKLEHRNH
jgi:hypothetical protein